MTAEQELMAKGQIVEDYTKTSARLVNLESDSKRLTDKLNELVRQISHARSAPAKIDLSFFNAEAVSTLLQDLYEAATERAKLQKQLKELGINVADR